MVRIGTRVHGDVIPEQQEIVINICSAGPFTTKGGALRYDASAHHRGGCMA